MRAIHDAGYSTAVFGKTHLHPQSGDLRDRADLVRAYGFDTVDEIAGPWASRWTRSHMTDSWERQGVWDLFRRDLQERLEGKRHVARPSALGLESYYDTYVGGSARKFLENYDKLQPWFVWVSFAGPHEPWDAPEPYASRYRPSEMPPPIPRPDLGSPPPGLLHERLSRRGPWNPQFDKEDVPRLRANYAGEVTLIDDQISQLVETVRARGELDRTVILFTSDHGEMNGDYGLLFKAVFLNGAVRVPLIIRTPVTVGHARVYTGPVELMDVGVTVAELAGIPQFRLGSGRSLGGVLRGTDDRIRTDALSEYNGEYMLLTDTWKIAFRSDLKPYLLFDVHEDPEETRNLAGRHEMTEVEADLSQLLRDKLASTHSSSVEPTVRLKGAVG
jgi:choline-sulfatase